MPRTKQFDEQEVLNKAMELFWEKGFHATSIQDLVHHLGINRASIYDTYGDKTTLFDRAFDNYRNLSMESLRNILNSESDVRKGFRKLFRLIVDDVHAGTCSRGCFVVNTITELVPGDSLLQKKLVENSTQTEALFTSYIQDAIDTGKFATTKKPETIAFTLFTLFSGLRVMAKIEQNPVKLNDMIEVGLTILE